MNDKSYRVNLDRLWNAAHTTVVENPVQTTLAANVARFTSSTGDCAAQGRQFDGVLFDFEPSGITADPYPDSLLPNGVSNQFEGIKQTLLKTGNLIHLCGAKVAIATHAWASTATTWGWTSAQYYYGGLNADYLMAMEYDSGEQSASSYSQWMYTQVNRIVDSVSGAYNGSVEPANEPRVFFGLPAFGPETASHVLGAENIKSSTSNVAQATLQAIIGRCSMDSRFCKYVRGASLYLHRSGYVCNSATQGTANCSSLNPAGFYDDSAVGSYYASQDDWASWVAYWLTNLQ
jgi:hypothetical protein